MDCETCKQLKAAYDKCISFGLRHYIAKRLVKHKLTAHPHKAKRLPWDNLPVSSPMIASIVERDN